MASLAGVVLPHEIWVQIFKHLATSDIINLCNVSEDHKYLLKEKDVVKYFDIGGDLSLFNINIYTFLIEDVGYRFIKTLNINKHYWIPLKDLRNILKYLPNLQELLALDTKLSLREKDVRLYGKLKTLSLTLNYKDFSDTDPIHFRNNMFVLKKFCCNISMKQEFFATLYKLFGELIGLEELWINDTDDRIIEPIKYDHIVFKLKFLKKLVIKSKVNIPFLDYKPFGLAKFFESRRFKSIVMCYERYPSEFIVPYRYISLFEPFENEIEKAWDVIYKFRCEMPYGPKSAQEFYETKQLKDVKFEELNFYHTRCFCNPSFIKATLDFLTSKNSKNLQKLSVKSCVLQQRLGELLDVFVYSEMRGYWRITQLCELFIKENGHPISKEHSLANLQERKYPIIEVIKNCKNLKTLELMSCSNHDFETNNIEDPTCNVSILDAYPFISLWMELEKLTVEVPTHSDGKFLKEVLMLCTKLKSLRVISYGTNERLNMNLYEALPYGSDLEDFCFENKHINIHRICLSLNNIQPSKIRRVCLIAHYNDSEGVKPVRDFLENNPQLIFFYIALTDHGRKSFVALQELLAIYRKKHLAKMFFVKKSVREFSGTTHIPLVHKDLLEFETGVSTVDFYSFR